VDAILGNKIFTHFDPQRIARLCENAGLFQRALENYTDLNDIKRTLSMNAHAINAEWLITTYFSTLSVNDLMESLKAMMSANLRQNIRLCVQVSIKFSEQLTPKALIELYESFKCDEGIFYYLGTVIATSQDEDVNFKYTQAACKLGKMKDVERVCKECKYIDGERVKNLLKEESMNNLLKLEQNGDVSLSLNIWDTNRYLTMKLSKLLLIKSFEFYQKKNRKTDSLRNTLPF
jgi:clathrin heavy chain